MSIVTDTDDVPEHVMQELQQSAEQAEGLYQSFVKKVVSAEGNAIEDASIELFVVMQATLPTDSDEVASQFLAAARLNCLLIAQLRKHLSDAGTPVSFDACNLFMQKLMMTVQQATMGEEHNSVH
jgi:hypothetical protein